MNKKATQIIEILSTLRTDSISYQKNPESLFRKYNLMFLGNNLNFIYTNDLLATIKNFFHFDVSNEELIALIPTACETLNMKYEPMKAIDDLNNPVPHCYKITLW